VVKNNKKLIVVVLGVALTIGLISYAFADNLTLSDVKVIYENLNKEFNKEKADLENAPLPTTETGIQERIQKSEQLKQKGLQINDLGQDLPKPPVDPVKKLENDILIDKDILTNRKNTLDPNVPEEAKELRNVLDKLQRLEKIEKDYKNNVKTLEETQNAYEIESKIKVK